MAEAMTPSEIGPAKALRVLAVTNMFPTEDAPTVGIFIQQQVRSLREAGVSVRVLALDRRRQGPGVYAGLRSRLKPEIEGFEPHIVHAMYGGVMAERVTHFVRDRPVIVTYHGSDLQGAPGTGLVRRAMARLGVWSSRRAARRASGVITVSDDLRDRLAAGTRLDHSEVIACGVDLQRFQPTDASACRERLGWEAGPLHVLFATNNQDPIKRPELARAAMEILIQGGVPARLHILQGVRYEDVPLWLNAADVLLLTSRREGSPTIVKEALACNRPVVSVAVGDVAKHIGGVDGCYVTAATPQALADGLRSVYRGPRSVDGRGRIEAHSLERSAERLIRFYERVLDAWSHANPRTQWKTGSAVPASAGPAGSFR